MILEREPLRDDKTGRIFVADGNHTQFRFGCRVMLDNQMNFSVPKAEERRDLIAYWRLEDEVGSYYT
jgi:hypothetical protein